MHGRFGGRAIGLVLASVAIQPSAPPAYAASAQARACRQESSCTRTSSSSALTATLTFYNTTTGAMIASTSQSLQSNAFWGPYQGDASLGLSAGQRASAVLTVSGGTVAVICNEAAPGIFMGYNGQ